MGWVQQLIDRKIQKVLSTLQRHPDREFHLQELSALSHVPLASTFRIVRKLAAIGLLDVVKHGKMKMYHLNKDRKTELDAMLGGRR